MGIFDNLKDIHALKQQATQMQAQLASERIEGLSKDGLYKVVINGNQEVLDIDLPSENLTKNAVISGIKEALTNARHKLEKIMREKMMNQL
jgi:DNA-binding protein YbaB